MSALFLALDSVFFCEQARLPVGLSGVFWRRVVVFGFFPSGVLEDFRAFLFADAVLLRFHMDSRNESRLLPFNGPFLSSSLARSIGGRARGIGNRRLSAVPTISCGTSCFQVASTRYR